VPNDFGAHSGRQPGGGIDPTPKPENYSQGFVQKWVKVKNQSFHFFSFVGNHEECIDGAGIRDF
jgi:hypothetical protein